MTRSTCSPDRRGRWPRRAASPPGGRTTSSWLVCGYVGEAQVTSYPAGDIPGFTWGHRLAGFGGNRVAMITSAGVFFTDDITASPIVWNPMTALPTGIPGGPCSIRSSTDGVTPTFFVQTDQCTGRGPDRLYRMDGTNGMWTRIDNVDGNNRGIGIFAADPTDPDRLYISYNPRGQGAGGAPSMQWSTDRGVTWHADLELDDMMTAGGVFKYLTTQGPSTNRGGAGAAFQGYAQPLLLAWSAEDPGVLVAGGVDSGVFLSLDAGANWSPRHRPADPVDERRRPPAPAQVRLLRHRTGRRVRRLHRHPGTRRLAPRVHTAVRRRRRTVRHRRRTRRDAHAPLRAPTIKPSPTPGTSTTTASSTTPPVRRVPFTTVGQDSVFPVHLKVTDPDGAYDVDDTTVTVLDAAPTIEGLGNDGPVAEGSPVTVTGTASDPGWLDVLTATIDWGDATPAETVVDIGQQAQPDTTLALSGSHVYGDDGRFSVAGVRRRRRHRRPATPPMSSSTTSSRR